MTDQVDELIEALGLNEQFAGRFDKAPWHPQKPEKTVTAAIVQHLEADIETVPPEE